MLEELEREEIDRIVCLGDVAVGPQPTEAVERVRARLLGGDGELGRVLPPRLPDANDELSQRLTEIGAWWAEQLTPEQREYMESFAERRARARAGFAGRHHGSPRSYEDFVYATTDDEELESMLDGERAPVMALGHTHFQMLRRFDDVLLVNPGSVVAARRRRARHVDVALGRVRILSVENGRFSVDLRRTDFDVGALVRLIVESGMPHADWWAGLWIGKPPSGLLSPF